MALAALQLLSADAWPMGARKPSEKPPAASRRVPPRPSRRFLGVRFLGLLPSVFGFWGFLVFGFGVSSCFFRGGGDLFTCMHACLFYGEITR